MCSDLFTCHLSFLLMKADTEIHIGDLGDNHSDDFGAFGVRPGTARRRFMRFRTSMIRKKGTISAITWDRNDPKLALGSSDSKP